MGKKIKEYPKKTHLFYCPACDTWHGLNVAAHGWTYNNNPEKPTYKPSVLVTTYDGKRCHSFINDGVISYLRDCTHDMAGKSVELPDIPEEDLSNE